MKTLTAALAVALLSTGSAFAYCAGMAQPMPTDQTTADTAPIILPGQVGS
jgi:hypothetical protein